MRRLLLASALALAAATPAHAGWTVPGPALDADRLADARTPALAVVDGAPVTAWVEGAFPETRIRVTGGHVLGSPGAWAIEPDLAVVGGVLHVAWSERDADGLYDVRVAALRDGVFVPVGPRIDLIAGSDAREASLLDNGGEPWVAWTEGDNQSLDVHVARFDGTGWPTVGGVVDASARARAGAVLPPLAPPAVAGQGADLALVGGVVHVAWDEGGDARVARLAGGTWADLGGGPANAAGAATELSLADLGGVAHLAWRSAEGRFTVRAARLSGAAWEALGEVGTGGQEPSLAVDAGTAWIAWAAQDGVRVARLSGGAWTQPQDVDLGAQGVQRDPSLAFAGGIPHVAFSDGVTTSSGDVRVARLDPEVLTTTVSSVTHSSATLTATLETYGLPHPVSFAHGEAGAGLPLRTATATGDVVTATLTGLTARTAYEAQVLAGPVQGPVVAFTTPKRNGK